MENSSLNHTENHKTEEKETKRTPIKQRKKENEVLRFIREHIRYFAAGALVVVLILVLAMCAKPKGSDSDVVVNANATESTQATEEAYQVDANENINALITQYYTAYAAGDVTTLSSIATPISANEQSYIGLFSQYVDEYQNIKCYTKTGLDANSYLVSVSMEIKFTGVDTTAPGLDFFYVRTNDDGTLYIDNLYSQYNLANQENALDTSVQSLIGQFESESVGYNSLLSIPALLVLPIRGGPVLSCYTLSQFPELAKASFHIFAQLPSLPSGAQCVTLILTMKMSKTTGGK